MSTPLPRPAHWLLNHHRLLLSIVLPLLVLALLGVDRNWDLRNYHLYNPHAWLSGRYAVDVAPAQLQSWHNPMLDVPLYLLVRAGAPTPLVALWLALPLIGALACLLLLYRRLAGATAGIAGAVAVAVLAVTGAGAVIANGASFNDAYVALAMLAALCLVTGERPGPGAWVLAGLIAGAMAGLKLTAAVYCIGLAAAALAAPGWRAAPVRLLALAVGGLVGFALTFGAWGWTQWQAHANPVFPYFNQVFQSPDALPLPWADTRFRPEGLGQALAIPFQLLKKSRAFSEIGLRDPRLLLGFIALVWLAWRQRAVPASVGDGIAGAPRATLRIVAAFFVASFLLWALQYGIYRYVLPLEMLACALLVAAVATVRTRRPVAWLVVACLLVLVGTRQPRWERGPFAPPYFQVDLPTLPSGSMVVLSSREPLAYAALALPADVPVLSIYNNMLDPHTCSGLQAQAEARVRAHRGPLWLLRTEQAADDAGQRIAQEAYGLTVNGECQAVATSFGPLRLCPLLRAPRALICAPSAPPDRPAGASVPGFAG